MIYPTVTLMRFNNIKYRFSTELSEVTFINAWCIYKVWRRSLFKELNF